MMERWGIIISFCTDFVGEPHHFQGLYEALSPPCQGDNILVDVDLGNKNSFKVMLMVYRGRGGMRLLS